MNILAQERSKKGGTRRVWLWPLCLFLGTCGQPVPPPVADLAPLQWVELPQTGLLRTTVLDMVADDKGVYLSKSKPAEILGFDHQLGLLLRLDGFAEGTEHFDLVGNLAVRDDLFFIWESPKAIEVLDRQGSFVERVLLPFAGASRFAVDARMWLYLCTPVGEQPIEVLNLNGVAQQSFGQWIENPQQPYRRRFDNTRHLFLDDSGNLVSLSTTKAQIEIYSKDGLLLVSRELAENPYFAGFFAESERFYNEHPMKRFTSVFQLVVDAVLDENQIYLLFASKGPGRSANHVMRIEVTEKGIEPGPVYRLLQQEGSTPINGARLVVWKDRLYVFNLTDNRLYRFPSSSK